MNFSDFLSAVKNGPPEAMALDGPTMIIPDGVSITAPSGPDDQIFRQQSRLARNQLITGQLSPLDVSNALTDADGGNLGGLQALYMRMTRSDARIKGHVKALHAGLLSNPLRVFPAKTKTPAAKEYAEIAADILFMTRHSVLIRRAATPYLSGPVVFEPAWTFAPGRDGTERVLPYDLRIVPQTLYRMDMESKSDTYGEIKVVTEDESDGVAISTIPWGRLIFASDDTEKGWYDLGGSLRSCIFWYLVKTKNATWWAEMNEVHGEPQRLAYYDKEVSDEKDLQKLETLLRNVGRAAWAILPNDLEFEMVKSELNGSIKTYEDLIELANREIAISLLGVTQTSDGGKNGSFAKANVHMSVQHQILESLGLMIQEILDELVVQTIAFNVGPDYDPADLPSIRIVIPNPEQKETKARVFKLAQEIGVKLPKQHVHDELGIPDVDEDDEILEPVAQAASEVNGADQKRDFDKEDDTRRAPRE